MVHLQGRALSLEPLKPKEGAKLGQYITSRFLSLPKSKIFLIPDSMNNIDKFSKYLVVEKNHQFCQQVTQFTFLLKLLDEIGLLAVSQHSVAFYSFINVFGLTDI